MPTPTEIVRRAAFEQRRQYNSGMPEPVTGETVCPVCSGERVVQLVHRGNWHTAPTSNQHLMWDGQSGIPYIWCQACGGEGTIMAALERTLGKA